MCGGGECILFTPGHENVLNPLGIILVENLAGLKGVQMHSYE